jgi:2,3-bisphosphoglycerate-dependent phosphoglycerate mutase
MRMTTVHSVLLQLARHGETADNAGGLILGHRDPPLSPLGRTQAAQLASKVLAIGVRAIWTSPLLRARETAAVIGETIGTDPTVLADLIESYRGSWEGQPIHAVALSSPELYAAFEGGDPEFTFPGGESLRHQVKRTRRALDVVAAGPQPSLVVAHAGTIRAALLATGRRPPPESALPHSELLPVQWVTGAGGPEPAGSRSGS